MVIVLSIFKFYITFIDTYHYQYSWGGPYKAGQASVLKTLSF
jgi:hypothetical protein